jgi:hypothetical protein
MTDKTATELRQGLALAIHRYDNHYALSGNDIPSKHHYGEADAVLEALEEFLDIGDAEAWCKSCRRVWEGKAHQCESPAEREVAAARKFAAEMRDFCSPHGVATDYADRLIASMDRAKEAQA